MAPSVKQRKQIPPIVKAMIRAMCLSSMTVAFEKKGPPPRRAFPVAR
jgi:hypothetical protein